MSSRSVSPAQGMTLLEVVVSIAILSMLALALLSATIPLSDASADQGAVLEMDRQANKFLSQLRRELRQSGYQGDGTPRVVRNDATTLTFAMRTGPDDPADWSSDVRYALAASKDAVYRGIAGNPARYRITRTQGGVSMDVIDDVASVTYTFPANSKSIEVTLVLLRARSRWTDGTTPPPIRREYTDQIEMMNAEVN